MNVRFSYYQGLEMSELPTLSDDLLYGAGAIARFMFGERDRRRNRRKVYALVAAGLLPTFHLGKTICARKSSIMNDVVARERAARQRRSENAAVDVA